MCRILLYRWAGRGGSRNGILPITSNLKERNNVQNRKLYEVRLKDIDGNEIVIVEFAALPNAAGSEFNQTGIEDWTAKTGQTSICGENDVFLIVIKFNNTICNDFGWMDIEKTSCNGYEVA